MHKIKKAFIELCRSVRTLQIIIKYSSSSDDEMLSIVEFLRKGGRLDAFCYDWISEYQKNSIEYDIYRDQHTKLLYTHINNHKMFFSRDINTIEQAQNVVSLLEMEQDDRSPHLYETSGFHVNKNDVVIDAGTAEGYFALKHIESAKKIILIECDEGWIEAIKLTFAEELKNGKVVLIEKMLSNYSDQKNTTLDEIYNKYGKIDFIKMDIEGGGGICTFGREKTVKRFARLS